jgi:8-oxo-dGTP diphosphatase
VPGSRARPGECAVAVGEDGKHDSELWTASTEQPGETPADAAIRETAEETGLAVTSAGEIARRVHPVTGRLIVYVAATPAQGAGARPGRELTEVRWVTPGEADELTGGTIFEPVRLHIRQSIAV